MWNFFLIMGAMLGLGACSSCPIADRYTKTPHNSERTVSYQEPDKTKTMVGQEPAAGVEEAYKIFWNEQK